MNTKLAIPFILLFLVPMAVFAQVEVEEVFYTPQPATPGESIRVTYSATSSSTIGELRTHIFVEDLINHEDVEQVRDTEYVYTRVFDIPQDVDASKDITVRILAPDQSPIVFNDELIFETEQGIPVFVGTSDVDIVVDPVRDVLEGDVATYQIKVFNSGDDASVRLSLSGTAGWATYEFLPSSNLFLDSGDSVDVKLRLRTLPGTTGLQKFQINADYNGQRESQDLRIAILEPVREPNNFWLFVFPIIVIGILVALLILAHEKGWLENGNSSTSQSPAKKSTRKKSRRTSRKKSARRKKK